MSKKEVTKFSLERFEIAKLQNPKAIVGGSNQPANVDPNTNTIGGTDSKVKGVGNGG